MWRVRARRHSSHLWVGSQPRARVQRDQGHHELNRYIVAIGRHIVDITPILSQRREGRPRRRGLWQRSCFVVGYWERSLVIFQTANFLGGTGEVDVVELTAMLSPHRQK
ncbi:MAG: hypothetical protein CO108_08390 [Deltaproteobacteria bacterium CG_4_9_14_3_um_filter_63_12]|nr:MAG: hypothetical protein CO108_08390 [Deltaproteobacteria bacterium CG_4_9_14_3_um_filter_63_12]